MSSVLFSTTFQEPDLHVGFPGLDHSWMNN